MKYKKYPSYKDIGVVWLGEIPELWDARRLGFYFDERREKVSDKVFSPLSVTKNGIVPQLENAAKSDDGDNRKKVCKGDFVINSRSDRKGSSGLSALNGSVSLINTVIQPKNINENYIHYLLKSQPFQEEYYRYGKGIVADLWSTNYSEMKNIIICSPTLEEQQQIANFLDKATAKIHILIEKQTKLIEILKEKRQAVISHAVTKGINPNAKMKDSGVEWLGVIPEHWEVKKLKFVLQLLNKKEKIINQIVVALENIESWSGKYIESDSSYQGDDVAFCIGDILFGKLRPYLAKVFLCSFDGIAFGDLLAYRPIKDYASKYAFYSLISEDFIKIVDSSTYGTKMPRASSEFLSEMRLTVPPLKEQQQIANYLDEKTSKIDILIEKSNKSIELLKEKRTAIISAAVTGKIDVREKV